MFIFPDQEYSLTNSYEVVNRAHNRKTFADNTEERMMMVAVFLCGGVVPMVTTIYPGAPPILIHIPLI